MNSCGTLGRKVVLKAGDLRALASRGKKEVQVSRQELDIAAGTVLKHEGETARGADAGDGRRGKTKGHSCRQLAQLAVEMRLDRLKLLLSRGPVVPGLERHGKERVIAGANVTQQTEAHDAGGVFHPWGIQDDFLNLRSNRGRPFQ